MEFEETLKRFVNGAVNIEHPNARISPNLHRINLKVNTASWYNRLACVKYELHLRGQKLWTINCCWTPRSWREKSCWKAGRRRGGWRIPCCGMLRMSGLKTADVLALTTGFVVTLDDPSMDSMTVMRSVGEPCNGSEPDPCGQSAFPRFLRRKYRPGCAVPPGAGYLSCQAGN